MQKIFNVCSQGTLAGIQQEIKKIISSGYEIKCISHAVEERQQGPYYTCLVVAEEVRVE